MTPGVRKWGWGVGQIQIPQLVTIEVAIAGKFMNNTVFNILKFYSLYMEVKDVIETETELQHQNLSPST